MFACALSVLALMTACNQAQDRDYECITINHIVDEADLTEIAFDFRVHALKSSDPLDGIGGIKCWDGVWLARTNDDRKMLRFDNYQLTWVLDRLGRGPGEYFYISDFSYDKANNCIYIENDSSLVTYDATTMEFKGKQPVNISIQNILNVEDKMVYFGYLLDDYKRDADGRIIKSPDESLVLVDRDERNISKGKVLYTERSNERSMFGYPELFFVNSKNYSTCFPGVINRIVTFNENGTTDVYRFKLGDSPVSKDLLELMEKEVDENDIESLMAFYNELAAAIDRECRISQVYNIMVDDKTVSFRARYSSNNGSLGSYSPYLYFVHNEKGTKVYKHLRVPGLLMDVDPTGANGNHQVAIIENLGDLIIDDNVPMSDLAEQIVSELRKQNDDNPVVLEFRFK
jgi:hypothetical protein